MLSYPENNASSFPGRAVKGPAGGGRARLLRLCLCLGLGLLLSACGYGFYDGTDTVLGEATHTMKIKGVEQPTLYPWLGQIVRSDLRDEINSRKVAVWVDSGDADYAIQINITYFTIRSYISNYRDQTLISSIELRLEGIVYDGRTNAVVWRSGQISYSDNYESYDERDAAQQLSRQVARRLVQAIRNEF